MLIVIILNIKTHGPLLLVGRRQDSAQRFEIGDRVERHAGPPLLWHGHEEGRGELLDALGRQGDRDEEMPTPEVETADHPGGSLGQVDLEVGDQILVGDRTVGSQEAPVSVTLVGDTGDQLPEKSRFQKASHWPFSLR
jgi:hypothetical protein